MNKKTISCLALGILIGSGCASTPAPTAAKSKPEPSPEAKAPAEGITKEPFGLLPDGAAATLYTLTNKKGARLRLTDYGGIVVSIEVPDKDGKLGDVVLGYDKLDDYVKASPYFGCLVGRYANRIAKGKFKLEGKTYTLAQNNNGNHLHGGLKGFDKVLWKAEEAQASDGQALRLSYVSPDGEEGYPGTLKVEALIVWTEEPSLRIEFRATTDKTTVLNLTHHSYFNLGDAGATPILEHQLMIPADSFTPVDAGLIPTGQLKPVKGTPFDFKQPALIGARIEAKDEQLKRGKGYDHNWVLNRQGQGLSTAAWVKEPKSGRTLEVLTTEPGIQFYSGNFLDGSNIGKGGTVYKFRHGFCLEPQRYPDSPNHPKFPSTELKPGQTYSHILVYRFGAQE